MTAPDIDRCDPADVGVDAAVLAGVDEYVEKAIADSVVPGAVVLAARGRRLFYEKAWGHAFRPDGSMRELTTSLRQPFFSFSKGIATTVACWVHGQGAFDWDDPVEAYIPGYGRNGKEGTRVRDLLSHTCGLPSHYPFLTSDDDWADAVRSLVEADAEFPPGSASPYHPISGHLLAGAVCMAATGRTFTDLSRQVLDAMAAPGVDLVPPADDADDIAVVPAPGMEGPSRQLVAWQPGAGYTGTPYDVLRILHFHLDEGRDVIPWSSLSAMHEPQFKAQLDEGKPGFHGWALGWMVGYASDRLPWSAWLGFGPHTRPNTFSHAGHWTVLGAGDPDRDCAVAICVTEAARGPEGLSQLLATEIRVTINNTILAACREDPGS